MNINKQYEIIKMLSGLFKKGYTLNESIELMSTMSNRIMIKIKALLDSGQTLSSALKTLKFIKMVYETVEIGEATNRLNDVMQLIEYYLLFYIQTRNQINKVLMYPAMLLSMAVISIEFIRLKLYPVIHALLTDFQVEENKFLMFISFNLLKMIGMVVVAISLVLYFYKPIQNVVPVVKTYRSLYVAHHLKILLACGNSLEASLNLIQKALDKRVYQLEVIRQTMFNSNQRIPTTSAFSHPFIYFFKLGMNSNNLYVLLDDFTSIYFDHLNNLLTKIVNYIQLILFTTLAVNILLVYYVVMIPMFNITQSI